MVILIDTNIILDHLIPRQQFADVANEILSLCVKQKCNGYMAAHSITNIFYILRKQFSAKDRKEMLLELCEFIEVANIQKIELINALTNDDFDDLEDLLQVECAKTINADYIVTRNIADFSTSVVPAILPEAFLKILAEQEQLVLGT